MSEANAGLYQAKITYGTLTLELQASVTHLKFLELSTSVPLPVEFNTYYITCQFTGIAGAAVPTITWFKNNQEVSFNFLCFRKILDRLYRLAYLMVIVPLDRVIKLPQIFGEKHDGAPNL